MDLISNKLQTLILWNKTKFVFHVSQLPRKVLSDLKDVEIWNDWYEF